MEAAMTTVTRTRILSLALTGGLLLAAVAARAVDSPNVKRLGKTIAQYEDDKIQVAVSWKYPQLHPEEKWTYFETWMKPAGNKPLDINREDVALFLPDGTRLNLPSQKKLAEGLPDIRRVLAVGDVSRDPMEGYFRARDRAVRIGFQEVPGTAITFDFRGLGPRDAGYGDLFFENPKGKWEKGIYTFSIQNKDVDVKLPIPIGIEGELERVK
jgi:hypothetical protein